MSKFILIGDNVNIFLKKGAGSESSFITRSRDDAIKLEGQLQLSARRKNMKANCKTGHVIINNELMGILVAELIGDRNE